MPRPLRIEYENAYYHVMNRGRSRQKIFYGKDYYDAFLATLAEAHQRFGLQVLCYCLMSNHYHLLVKTPEANLGRAMRHINGVYTQRHNRLRKTDGSLFRGRYKAIVVEEDSYQLQLSRYIHRNPLEAKLVERLSSYSWSSYPYYVSRKTPPDWLYPQEVFDQLHVSQRVHEKYKSYVESGIDEEILQFYGKGNQMPYLGSESFRAWAYSQRVTDESAVAEKERYQFREDMDEIIRQVASVFKVTQESIEAGRRGRAIKNVPRWVAMYLCQEKGGHRLIDIAKRFGLKRSGSIPTTIAKLKEELNTDKKLSRKLKALM